MLDGGSKRCGSMHGAAATLYIATVLNGKMLGTRVVKIDPSICTVGEGHALYGDDEVILTTRPILRVKHKLL